MATCYNRWLTIDSKDVFVLTLRKMRRLGIALIDGWKADMCCWYSLRFRCSPEQLTALQAWWDAEKFEWFRRMPRGAWKPRHGKAMDWEEVEANLKKCGR